MSEIVPAIYENGVLRPLTPLALQEHQTVRVQVLPEASESSAHKELQVLIDAGMVTPPPRTGKVKPVSEAERRELARKLGQVPGKPLSEIIIEDRGEE